MRKRRWLVEPNNAWKGKFPLAVHAGMLWPDISWVEPPPPTGRTLKNALSTIISNDA